jgi:membrane protein
VYGSIGALIALMIWIQLLSIALLFGYEVNASLHYGRKLEVMRYNTAITKAREAKQRA